MWRVITAIILIPLVLGTLFLANSEVFRWISLVVFSLIGIEWGNLCQFKRKSSHIIFLIGLVMILFFLPIHQVVLWIGALFWIIPLYYCISYSCFQRETQLPTSLRALMGWVALPCAYQGLITLKTMNMGIGWILWLLLLIWAADSFAYFTGKAWGKRRLAPKISPNKTQEGLLGGVIGAMLLASIAYYFVIKVSYVWFIVALVSILLGVLGDLFESLLKRLANVKDSGRLLPGHGGIFDRLDSLVAALPFYALCLYYLS